MMTSEKFSEFRYFRDLSIVWIARNSKLPVQQILQKRLNDFDELNKFFTNDLLITYKCLRDGLSTDERWLFTTDDGKLYAPGKFAQNIQRMLEKAHMPSKPNHPAKLSQAQVEALLELRFQSQRASYQQALAGFLLGIQALRPEEVAGLYYKDIDLYEQIIILRETKGQEVQIVPMHPDLVKPIERYLQHIHPDEPLFIRSTGQPWNRKDVYNTIEKLATRCDLTNINPRRLRSTVAHEMISAGVPFNVISELLRHKDKATAPRHYTALQGIIELRKALNLYKPLLRH